MNPRDLDNYITGHYGEDQFLYERKSNMENKAKKAVKKPAAKKKAAFKSDPDYIRRAQELNPGVPVRVLKQMERESPFVVFTQTQQDEMSLDEALAVLNRMARRDRHRQMIEKATDMGYDRMAKGGL
ncbi:MAG TPA: hypothetical protein VGF90_05600 [Verrucomicrobiae bacterium]|jgi:hypothetical protein